MLGIFDFYIVFFRYRNVAIPVSRRQHPFLVDEGAAAEPLGGGNILGAQLSQS